MPSSDFFNTGVAPMQSPFSNYMNPKTMSQQRAMQPSWLNVGGVGRGDPFGQSKGDISGSGWENPIDAFTRQAEESMAKLAQQGMAGGVPGQAPATGGLSGNTPTQYDQYFISAAAEMSAKYGVNLTPALLKSIAHVETGGQFNMPVRPSDGYGGGPTVGIMQIKPEYWGGLAASIGADIYDPQGNIRTGAALMAKSMAERGGSWERALTEVYFPGPDVNGTTQGGYVATVNQLMAQYGAPGGGLAGGATNGFMKGGNAPAGGGNASSVIQTATSYVGKVPYVWGGIPGKGQTPTGWDCSGFTYWLDQNYGDGSLPMGSHYQFQQAQQSGRLKTNPSQIQPGDLVFFNTGNFAGGGAHLNAAGHVGMYIGNDQFVHAANPSVGTIISNFSGYTGGQFIGGMAMSWSGGGAYSAPMAGGTTGYAAPSGNLMAGYGSIWDANAPWRSYQR